MGGNDYIVERTWFNEFSFLNAIVFFSIFSLILFFLCRKTSWMERMGLRPFWLFVCLAVVRLVLPIEMPFSQILGSWTVLPAIQRFLKYSLFRWQRYDITVFGVLIAVWIAGAGILVCRFIWQWIAYSKRTSRYPQAPEEMLEDVKAWIPDFWGRVRFVETGSVPHFSGFFRPAIFLPMMDYEIQDLRLILLHEWQHFRNRDQWSKLIGYLLCCLFWWNPFIWILKSKMDQLLELRCDYAVLAKLKKEECADYYTVLLKTYQSMKKQKGFEPEGIPALIGDHSHNIILQRFQMGQSFSQMQKPSKVLSMVFSGLLMAAFCVSYGVIFQPQGRPSTAYDGKGEIVQGEIFNEFPEDSYLTPNEDGSYTLHCDGSKSIVQDITVEPFVSLPIIE